MAESLTTEALLAEENLAAIGFRGLLANPQAVCLTDCNYSDGGPFIIFVNPAYEALTGYKRDELIGKNPRILQGSRPSDPGRRKLKSAIRNGKAARARVVNYRKDGSAFKALVDIKPVTDSSGVITNWIGILSDITEDELSKLEFDRLKRTLRRLSEDTPALLWVSDERLNRTFSSGRWQAVTGVEVPELLGRGWLSLVHPSDVNNLLETYRQLDSTQSEARAVYRLMCQCGRYQWMMDHAVPDLDSAGRIRGFVGSTFNINDRKLSEEALAEGLSKERLLHRELRHRVTNNIQVISTMINMCGRQLQDPASKLALSLVSSRVNSVALVNRILGCHTKNGISDLASYLGELLRELRRGLQHGVSLEWANDLSAPLYMDDEKLGRLGLIAHELISNSLKHNTNAKLLVQVRLFVHPLGGHCISVSDSGIGMNTDYGESSNGIGLKIVESLAEQIQVQIRYLSSLGKGLTVEIILPNENTLSEEH